MKAAINGATTMPYSLEEDICAAAEAGFQGIEIWWEKVPKYLESHTMEELAASLKRQHIVPVGICPFLVSPFRDTKKCRETFERALETAEAIGCDLITVCPDFRPAGMSVEDGRKRHAEEFSWYAGKAQEKNIRLAIEPIAGHTMVPGPAEALCLAEMAGSPDNLGIVLDTFHYMRSGITEEAVLSIPKDRLYIVHINDSQPGMAEELRDADRLYPYEGCINLDRYREMLETVGYEGYCSVEVFRPEYWEQKIKEINKKAFQSSKRFWKK